MVDGTRQWSVSKSTLALAAALVLITTSCSTEDAVVGQARSLLAGSIASSADYAGYAVALAVDNPSPEAQSLIPEGVAAENLKVSRATIRVIVDNPPASTQEALRGVFETKRGLHKLTGAVALARLGDDEALEWVRTECLDETGQSLTIPAVKLLAEKGEEDALTPFLRSRMGNDEPSIRNEAYVMLGAIHQDWATRLLVEGLDNEFGAEREQAILSLGQTGDPAVAKKLEKFANTQGLVFATLEALGHLDNPDSIKILTRQLKHKSSLVRMYAASALWRLGEEETAVEILKPMAEDEDPATRMNVAQQIFGIQSPQAIAILTAMATDQDGSVRLAAVQALGEFKDPSLGPVFVTALADKSYQVHTAALDALAFAGSVEDVEQIKPFLENQNPYVKISAANAILAISARGAGPA